MNARVAPSILIVEDERIVASDLQQTLQDMGYDAFAVASSAEEAVACSTARHPDLVLMDIRIRGSDDGIATASLLKKRFPVAVIYLTAHADEAVLERAKRTEPDGYLVKPVKASELRSMIEITMHRRALERAREQLRSQERRLHAITDSVPVSVGYFDRHGHVEFANRAFREAVQFEEPAEGVAASRFLGAPLHRQWYAARQRALAGETVHFVSEIERAGERRSYEVTCLPDRDESGGVAGTYAIAYDVTERMQLARRLEQVREEERRKVATILHDGLAQDLFALKLGLTRLDAEAERAQAVREISAELQGMAVRCMEDTRNLANELRPVALGYAALGAVIGEHARHFAGQAGLDIEMLEPTPLPAVSEAAQLLLFRAAQEALTNVARHAHAKHVRIRLEMREERVVLEVEDDGVGISGADPGKTHSLGLASLRERAERLGGRFEIRRTEPHGTLLRMELPRGASG